MLSAEDYDRYMCTVNNGIRHSDLLTEKEDEFVTDFRDKLVKYRRATNVSEAQERWLDSIETKLRDELGHHFEG